MGWGNMKPKQFLPFLSRAHFENSSTEAFDVPGDPAAMGPGQRPPVLSTCRKRAGPSWTLLV